MTSAKEIEARAAEFLVRRDGADWQAEDEVALAAWLAESAEHKAAFWRLEHGLAKVNRLAALRSPLPERTGARPWAARLLPLAASVLVAVALGLLVLQGLASRGTHLETPVGGAMTTALEDGSRVQLSTATELKARITREAREVWLERGEAYFEVARNPSRPFVVHAGSRTVTVLGTKFSVRREGAEVRVAVMEGRVRIDGPAQQSDAPRLVGRGDMVIADGRSALVRSGELEAVENALSWRKGMLTFDQTSIEEAAAEFNRFNTIRLEVADSEAAALRIGGAFEATNAEAFVRLLREAYGLHVERDGDVIRISS